MKTNHKLCIFTVACTLQSCNIGWNIWDDPIDVDKVINGNTVQLENGVNVILLGVDDTRESQSLLNEKLNDSKTIVIHRDSSTPELYYVDEHNNTIYGYVSMKDGDYCLNTEILRSHKSGLCENPYLQDSLTFYSSLVKDMVVSPIVNPVPTPQLDTELEELVNKNRESVHNAIDHSNDAWNSDGNQNCEMLSRTCDYTNSITKSFANLLASKAEGEFNVNQICEIYSYLRNKWKYVNDPADNEYVAYASESIADSHLSGDCDDFTILMASSMLAIGGNACINTASQGENGHAFAEVDVSKFNLEDVETIVKDYFGSSVSMPDHLYFRKEGNSVWLNLDWQTMFPGGKYWLDANYDRWDSYTRNNGVWKWTRTK